MRNAVDCMCVHVYAQTHARATNTDACIFGMFFYLCMQTCAHAYTYASCICTSTYIHECAGVCLYVLCVCICLCLCICICICKCLCICIFDLLLIVCGCLCMHKHMRAQQTQMHVFFVMCFLTWGASADACSSRAQDPPPGRQRDQRTAAGRVRPAHIA